MNQLRSSFKDFRQVFDQGLCVRYIAEPLISFDSQMDAKEVHKIMKQKEFDVAGIRESGSITGMVLRNNLGSGMLGKFKEEINKNTYVQDWEPMLNVLELLKYHEQLFVLSMGEVFGIVMRGDLQKTPVRMWFFGIISLLEMQLLRVINIRFPNEEWKNFLTEERLAIAKIIFSQRKEQNIEIDLADCLQLADKIVIVLENEQVRNDLGIESKSQGKTLLGKTERLRNDLAHSQDFVTSRWPELVDLIKRAEKFVEKCETYNPERILSNSKS
jgi:hypothetical protein